MKKIALLMIIALTISVFANAQTRVEIKSADLPKVITDRVAKDFAGFAIQNAYKVNHQNHTSYELIIAKGTEKEKLAYSSNGIFIKKSPLGPGDISEPTKNVQPKAQQKVEAKPQPTIQPSTQPEPKK